MMSPMNSKAFLWSIAVLGATASLSCGPENAAPPPKAEGSSHTMQSIAAPSATPTAHTPITASAAAPDAAIAPPKDAQFTIYCSDYSGPAHVDEANQMKAALLKSSGMRGWYVVHQEDRSTLFFGYYHETQSPALLADRKRVEALTNRLGDKLFRNAYALPIDSADPVAPPEWNLALLRKGTGDTQHFWSLQIAAYKDSPLRKSAAVDAVREARAQGVEAYFYHGPSVSSVCVGCWPMEAVRRQEASDGEAASASEGDSVMISPIPLPAKWMRAAEDNKMTVLHPVVEVDDKSLREMMTRYPQHFVNGSPEGSKQGDRIIPKPSALVQIPTDEPSPLGLSSRVMPTPEAERVLSPTGAQPQGSGKLRSLGQ